MIRVTAAKFFHCLYSDSASLTPGESRRTTLKLLRDDSVVQWN